MPGCFLCGLVNDPTMDDSRPGFLREDEVKLSFGSVTTLVFRDVPKRREAQVLFDIVVMRKRNVDGGVLARSGN